MSTAKDRLRTRLDELFEGGADGGGAMHAGPAPLTPQTLKEMLADSYKSAEFKQSIRDVVRDEVKNLVKSDSLK